MFDSDGQFNSNNNVVYAESKEYVTLNDGQHTMLKYPNNNVVMLPYVQKFIKTFEYAHISIIPPAHRSLNTSELNPLYYFMLSEIGNRLQLKKFENSHELIQKVKESKENFSLKSIRCALNL